MIVTSVTRIDSRRQKVILDNEYVFSLYNSEIKKFNIEADCDLDESSINYIESAILYPRAKDRALYILGRCDKTKKQICDKLAQGFYPYTVIEKVLNFLESYGYIDDERYALSYINSRRTSKSRRKIECELVQKGVALNIIKSSFKDDGEHEVEALKKLLNKDKYKAMLSDKQSKQKVIASMLRRGFEYDIITRCIAELE